jgi:hypothetical protein
LETRPLAQNYKRIKPYDIQIPFHLLMIGKEIEKTIIAPELRIWQNHNINNIAAFFSRGRLRL